MSCIERRLDVKIEPEGEEGFMLVGLIVAIFLILLALSVAAPKVSQALKREREVEAVHRGNQYVRAIRLYYRKFGHYPGSVEQLEKTNNIRFLRQQYEDPMTGKPDWKIIHVGEAKTTVKGFFGQPLAGLSGGGIGTPSSGSFGNSSPAGSGSTPGSSSYGNSSPGGSLGGGGNSSMPTTLGGSTTNGTNTTAAPGGQNTTPGTPGASGSPAQGSGPGSTLGSGFGTPNGNTGGAPFVGVGIPKDGDSITVLNEQTSYNTWEFIYDPRIEQLYTKGSLFGAGGNLGSGSGSSGFGSQAPSGNVPGFGSTPATGFGNPPGTSSPTPPPTAPTTAPQPPQ